MAVRKGSRSRVILYPETTLGVDPGSPVGVVLPLNASTAGVSPTQARLDAPVWMGNRLPFSSILGMKTATGSYPIGLEFLTFGTILKMFCGASVAPVNLAGGASGVYAHYFQMLGNDPLPFQLQHEYLEAGGSSQFSGVPAIKRSRGCRANNMRFSFSPSGPVVYNFDAMGIGDEAFTDLGGTKTDNGYTGKSYFNGMLVKKTPAFPAGQVIAHCTGFNWNPGNNLSRVDVAFNDGLATDEIAGNSSLTGDLTLLFRTDEDLQFYNEALNDNICSLVCVWADLPLDQCTSFLEITIPLVKFSRGPINVGGAAALSLQQTFRGEYDPTAAGQCALAPFVLTKAFATPSGITVPSPSNLGFKIDGGGTVTKALTPGSNYTPLSLLTDLSASGGISGATIDGYPQKASGAYNHVRVRSNTKGPTGSVQVDTTVANSAHALFGFNNTSYVGKAPDWMHVWLLNSQSTQY